MNPREIEVHIEELVLHGFEPQDRYPVADALERELHGLLRQEGLPAAWAGSPEMLSAGTVRLTKSPAATGKQLAAAIHRGA